MAIDKSTTKRIANLARIDMTPEEIDKFSGDLSNIISFMDQLKSAKIDGIAPMTSVTPMELRLRADEVYDGNNSEKILENAPKKHEGFFSVPKVIE